MIVTMVMVVVIAMAVVVVIVAVVVMAVIVSVLTGGCDRVGPAFRLERRFDFHDLAAERSNERGHAIRALQANTIGQDLHRHVAVAERMGDFRERRNVSAHFDEFFRSRDDFNGVAVIEQQCVVGAQRDRCGKVECDGSALLSRHVAALQAALFGIEYHRVDDAPARFAGFKNLDGA